jgi:hypothetical protein
MSEVEPTNEKVMSPKEKRMEQIRLCIVELLSGSSLTTQKSVHLLLDEMKIVMEEAEEK